MTVTEIRRELHAYIDTMPDRNLKAVQPLIRPILAVLANPAAEAKVSPDYTIETDLTAEEHAAIAETMKRYHANPGSFATLESVMARKPVPRRVKASV